MRRERRVRWEPASGVVDTFFDDEAVPGTQGLPIDLLRKVEPFPTKEVVAYDTAFLSGHVVEHYQVVLLDAAQRSVEQMQAKLEMLCAQQIPGDTHRNLQIYPEFSGPHVQARPRAGLAADIRLRVEAVSGDRQRLYRSDRRPSSAEFLEDRAPRARRAARWPHLDLAQLSVVAHRMRAWRWTRSDRSVEARSQPARCSNCDAPLDGPYCSRCGQKAVNLHFRSAQFISEVIDDALSLDTRLVRTVAPCCSDPGW